MPQQIRHLAWRERFYGAVRLLYAIYQVGGKCVTQAVQAFLLYPCCRKYPVITLAEIHRSSVIAMFIRHQGPFLSEVCFLPQVLNHGDGCVIQRYRALAGG